MLIYSMSVSADGFDRVDRVDGASEELHGSTARYRRTEQSTER